MIVYKRTCPPMMHVPVQYEDTTAKGKRKRDPNHPKQPPSAFFLFCNQKREELKATRPDVKSGPQIQAVLGEVWRSMSDDDRLPWKTEYVQRKAVYDEQMKLYVPPKIVRARHLARAKTSKARARPTRQLARGLLSHSSCRWPCRSRSRRWWTTSRPPCPRRRAARSARTRTGHGARPRPSSSSARPSARSSRPRAPT